MSTVGKTIAGKEIARCEKSKQPRMYCIASYVNTSDGQLSYKLCYRPENYVEMVTSPFVSRVMLLWQSDRMKRDYIKDVSEAHRTIEKRKGQAAQVADPRGKRPPYPKKRTCSRDCGAEPEWEWQFEDVWACLGCGKMIEGRSGKDPLEEESAKPSPKKSG